MKQYFSYLIIAFVCSAAMLFSCTDSDEGVKIAKPGVYFGEVVIDTQKKPANVTTPLTKGILSSNTDFDLIYDHDYIYLHVVGTNDAVKIPLYVQDCVHSNPTHTKCKCFRYRLVVHEDGSAVATPILEDGSLASTSLTIPADGKVYYSSVEKSVWEMSQGNISISNGITYYERDSKFNKEIYRSAFDFSIYELAEDMDLLIMNRTVACFNLVGLFYNGDEMIKTEDGEIVPLEAEDFERIMGSSPNEWYIKIYIGGNDFTDKYDIGLRESVSETKGGYYYNTGGFMPLSQRLHGYAGLFLQCFGYYTKKGNNLFSPVLGTEPVDVYILIKHWDGTLDPSAKAAWLASDEGALYTRMNITGNIYPVNNCFYILGLMMDLGQFKIAWDEAVKQKEEPSKLPARGIQGARYFTIPDAKIICETY